MSETSLDRTGFFEQYNLDDSALEEAAISWEDLMLIYNHHLSNMPNLQEVANSIASRLQRAALIHSVRVRIKDPAHLLEKIIRKRRQDPKRDIRFDNYAEEITDLIGIRALHLFKEDWCLVHEYINATWPVIENPVANVRAGDSEEYIQQFRDLGCDVENHPFGYRSVHYLIKSQPTKDVHIAELQVRTIFEEGWSEIDHRTRYPYDLSNSTLSLYLLMFNRLAGMADEMGSFVIMLQHELKSRDSALVEKTNELSKTIQALGLSTAKQKELEKQVADLSTASSRLTSTQSSSPILSIVYYPRSGSVRNALVGPSVGDLADQDIQMLFTQDTVSRLAEGYQPGTSLCFPFLNPSTSRPKSKTDEAKKPKASDKDSLTSDTQQLSSTESPQLGEAKQD